MPVYSVNLIEGWRAAHVAADARLIRKQAKQWLEAHTVVDSRREQLRARYRALTDAEQRRFADLGIPADDLDAIEAALDSIDPFAQVIPPITPTPLPVAPPPDTIDEGGDASAQQRTDLATAYALLEDEQHAWIGRITKAVGNLSVAAKPSQRRVLIGMALVKLAAAGWHDDDLLRVCLDRAGIVHLFTCPVTHAVALDQIADQLVDGDVMFVVAADGTMRLE